MNYCIVCDAPIPARDDLCAECDAALWSEQDETDARNEYAAIDREERRIATAEAETFALANR